MFSSSLDFCQGHLQKPGYLYLEVCLQLAVSMAINSQCHPSQEFLHPSGEGTQRERERGTKFSAEIAELCKTGMGFSTACNQTEIWGFAALQDSKEGWGGRGGNAGMGMCKDRAGLCGTCWVTQRDITGTWELCWLPNPHFWHELQGSPQADCLTLAVTLNSVHSAAS